ncbi:hypothetical protein AB0465_31645 [Streptomyces griseoviridis]|uniref:DUF4388 domain-containing protein n=1 Tax=Streptomyces griseoviridis TaxID=45398 RepID=A0A3S9Z675_STRGD|nr:MULTISPECIES: hypothetical protein [Streptomyces]AZS83169.1 hypothetical protein ELQ87_01825 [Streptomyces griseoviridis]MDH6695907.1 hypothetical protein [Streptomyces sp. MAA16]QCN89977.1 hypothetical protein DDJ31_37540 [Streptomyces griseoviridis]
MIDDTTEPAAGSRNIPALLADLRSRKQSRTVRLTGSPGGTLHLRDGLVVAMETPAAPNVESLLLRSGRITEEAWSAVCAADTTHGRLAEELVAQELVGAGELEIISLSALFDAAFALSLSRPEGWEVTEPVPVLYRNAGITPERLVTEISRRTGLLAGGPGSVAEFARTRMQLAAPAQLPGAVGALPARHQDVLANTDGRRTPRDIAFALGRGLFAVMLDLRRLLALGLVQPTAPLTPQRPSTATRTPSAPVPAPPAAVPLPRRLPGRNAPTPAPAPPATGAP